MFVLTRALWQRTRILSIIIAGRLSFLGNYFLPTPVSLWQSDQLVRWVSVITAILRLRKIPDHATFREKSHTLGWLDKLGGFLSLALCNLGNFD